MFKYFVFDIVMCSYTLLCVLYTVIIGLMQFKCLRDKVSNYENAFCLDFVFMRMRYLVSIRLFASFYHFEFYVWRAKIVVIVKIVECV